MKQGKVVPGQRIRIPGASHHNKRAEATDFYQEFQKLQQAVQRLRQPTPTDVIQVRNDTGDDLPTGSVVKLGQRLITTLTPDSIVIKADYPDANPANDTHGILLEPIRDDKIGRCQLSGICLARVGVNHTDDRYCFTNYDVSGDADLTTAGGIRPVAELIEVPAATGTSLRAVRLIDAFQHNPFFIETDGGYRSSDDNYTSNLDDSTVSLKLDTGSGATHTGNEKLSGLEIQTSAAYADDAAIFQPGLWKMFVTMNFEVTSTINWYPTGNHFTDQWTTGIQGDLSVHSRAVGGGAWGSVITIDDLFRKMIDPSDTANSPPPDRVRTSFAVFELTAPKEMQFRVQANNGTHYASIDYVRLMFERSFP